MVVPGMSASDERTQPMVYPVATSASWKLCEFESVVSADYVATSYSSENRAAVLRLHRQVLYRPSDLSARYLAWKYEDNPYIPEPTLALVFQGSDLVAMRGLCGTGWAGSDGTIMSVPAAEDLVVDQTHRGRGLFLMLDKQLARMAEEAGYPTLLSLSAGPETQQLQTLTGWSHVASLGRARRPAAVPTRRVLGNPLVRKIIGRGRRMARNVGLGYTRLASNSLIDRTLEGIGQSKPAVTVSAVADLDAFVELSANQAHRHRPERTKEFYEWRLANPDRRYRFVYWGHPEPSGFAILCWRPSEEVVSIVDSRAQDPEVHLALLSELFRAPRASYELLPSALPDSVRAGLDINSWDGNVRPGRDVEVYVKQISRLDQPRPSWPVDLIDTMLA